MDPMTEPDPTLRFSETVPGGWNFSHMLKRHTAMRLTDLDGRANVSCLFYNADHPGERFNMPDSLKSQHTAFFTTGVTCQSDCGRVLVSMTEDELGWHDCFCGLGTRELAAQKYGERPYHDARNDYIRNGLDSMLIELGKWGLGKRDLVAPLNLFSKAAPDAEGGLTFATGHSRAGASVTLRSEMNTLVVLNTCPHPLDPNPAYQPGPVQIDILDVPPPGPDDVCRTACEQNARAFINTERYFL